MLCGFFKTVAVFFVCAFLFVGQAYPLSRDPLSVELPDIEMMPGSSWYWAGQNMALNGVPMSIKIFTFKGSIDEVTQYYLGFLRSAGHGKLKQSQLREQVILGYQLGGYYYTIQLTQTAAGVSGKAVVTPSELNYTVSKKTDLPLPPRTNVSSKVDSLDGGRRAETLSADSRMDVGYVVDFYKEQLGADGWALFSQSGDQINSAVLSFQRGSELLQLTAKGLQHNNSQDCQFLINWLK